MKPRLSQSAPARPSPRSRKRLGGETNPAPPQASSGTSLRSDKIAPIDGPRNPGVPGMKVIAQDEETRRVIVAFGNQRYALDVTARMTKLKAGTGDTPASVSILKQQKGAEPRQTKARKGATLQPPPSTQD